MSSREFLSSTPRQVTWRIAEEAKRENRDAERAAQLACWIINSTRAKKDQIKVHDLIRRRVPRKESEP